MRILRENIQRQKSIRKFKQKRVKEGERREREEEEERQKVHASLLQKQKKKEKEKGRKKELVCSFFCITLFEYMISILREAIHAFLSIFIHDYYEKTD